MRHRTMNTPLWTASDRESVEEPNDTTAKRAYARFLERGGLEGNALEQWLSVEADLQTAAHQLRTSGTSLTWIEARTMI